MRYESEILYDLMKRDGLLNPSQDNLPYEDELKEKYVDEVKGAYPKVTDYRPEWMNYNLGYYIPADFPTETLANVTSGTVNNVVPYAFKSAILKGQTLVNLTNNMVYGSSSFDAKLAYSSNTKSYFVIIEANLPIVEVGLLESHTSWNVRKSVSNLSQIKVKFTPDTTKDIFSLRCIFSNPYLANIEAKCMIIEYQDGMENWDIPYFEGMQSVKMPVLKTTGKNLINLGDFSEQTKNGMTLSQNNNSSIVLSGETTSVTNYWFNNLSIKLEPNTYQFSLSYQNNGIAYFIKDVNGNNIIASKINNSVTITEDKTITSLLIQVNGGVNLSNQDINIQLESGSVATSYEPYKSNILTVNEEVELRGIGSVQDTLDCLTGEVTGRIGEIVLDGSDDERWTLNSSSPWTQGDYYTFSINIQDSIPNFNGSIIQTTNNRYQDISYQEARGEGVGCFLYSGGGQAIAFRQKTITTLNDWKTHLQANPIAVQYRLATESIKTVDLTSVNQDGVPSTFRPFEGTMHIQTDGTPLKPLFSGEIPVEATTQNLASFVALDGVERTVNEYLEDEEIIGDGDDEQLL